MSSNRSSQQERRARQTKRRPRRRARSVGATAIAAPRAQSIGMQNPAARRQYGRGETARRLEEERRASISARPAVYTQEPKRARVAWQVPSLSVAAFVIALLVAAVLLLYGPARSLYAAWREAGVLQAEYEVLAEQNAELNHRLERLQTLEGIEDEARRRGYAYPDEEALVVNGLEEELLADPAAVDEAIADHEANLPWYVPILDALFGYPPDDNV